MMKHTKKIATSDLSEGQTILLRSYALFTAIWASAQNFLG